MPGDPTPIRTSPSFERISGQHFRYRPPGFAHVRIEALRVYQDKTGLHGRAKLYVNEACVWFEDGKLTSGALLKAFAAAGLEHDQGPSWDKLLQKFTLRIINTIDEPEPPIDMATYTPTIEPPYLVNPLVPDEVPTLIFGPGGTGKSYLALYVAACVATGTTWLGHGVSQRPVIYGDWETDANTFGRRLGAVLGGMGVQLQPGQIIYRRYNAPLAAVAESLYRDVHETGAGLFVGDSMAGAEGTKKEYSDARDGALGVFGVVRSLGVGSMLVDHVNGEDVKSQKAALKAYGSAYKMFYARNAWALLRDDEYGTDLLQLGLYHRKVNEGPLLPPISFTMDYRQAGMVRFDTAKLTESNHLLEQVSTVERMVMWHRANGAYPAETVAAALGMTVDAVKKNYQRHRRKFSAITSPGGSTLWGVA